MQITIPAEQLNRLLTASAKRISTHTIITIQDHGKHYELHTQNTGEEKTIAGWINKPPELIQSTADAPG